MTKRIIFHHPLPLDINAKSASGIRPLKMIEAFEAKGYSVTLVTGYIAERKAKMKEVIRSIELGTKYEFLYGENSTMPAALTEENHFPKDLVSDLKFFRYCQKHGIKIGIFYRDIHWRFPEYWKKINWLKGCFAYIFYIYELFVYKRIANTVFLPSLEMSAFIPFIDKKCFKSLPPGTEIVKEIERPIFNSQSSHALKLIYVGGVNEIYRIQEALRAVSDLVNVSLTICTRERDWQNHQKDYCKLVSNNISIVHYHGNELDTLLKKSDIALIFVEPHKYWSFAMPVKLFEYLGYELPIIASSGTMAGDFVMEQNVGWRIEYSSTVLKNLLIKIIQGEIKLDEMKDVISATKRQNTWCARVEYVSQILS